MREIKFKIYVRNHPESNYQLLGEEFDRIINLSDLKDPKLKIRVGLIGDIKIVQFIGLKDKNGKEIYEGDVAFLEGTGEKENMVMKWNPEGRWNWVLISRLNEEDYSYKSGYYNAIYGCVLIGNIYENPEFISNTLGDKK